MIAKWVAVGVGMTNSAVTAYWLVGGSALLSTVGGEIERWGRQRTPGVLGVLAIVLMVKLTIAAVPVIITLLPGARVQRVGRVAGWVAAIVLMLYGGLLTVVGLLIQAGVVEASADADERALAWHAYLWDPWFLTWGLALGAWLRLSIPLVGRQASIRPSAPS
ncbi:DUF3995 domain-containing protein [Ilumatobacter sp.]|uniref:DUF3995 domain-containing protein n=1 Tax=Ilumatobacter sp. TaxID=1967498 RepID=UPI003C5F1F8C